MIVMPIAANTVIVVGSATTWPIICSRCDRPNRVKSGMLSDSVDQNAIVAVSAVMNTVPNVSGGAFEPGGGFGATNDVRSSNGPRPPAPWIAHATSSAVITSTNGAANRSTRRSTSMPRKMIRMFSPQNSANAIHCVVG